LGNVDQKTADRALEVLLEYGINHIDTAASYGDAELRIGPWMPKYRGDFFLATKTEERTYQGAKEELARSLERMQTDSVDLWQMHILVDPQEWETAMGPGGALEAFIEAREQGLVRYLGVTGHGVTIAEMHLRSLARYDFDSVLLPYSLSMMENPKYAEDFEALYEICREKKVAFQAIKTLTRGPWGEKEKTHNTWYEPFTDQADIDRVTHWALSRSGIFLNTAADVHLLPKVLDAVARFEGPVTDAEVAQLTMEPLFVE
jgi:aryl-alcohol dehydrogenase-like predicted oxidoreductase